MTIHSKKEKFFDAMKRSGEKASVYNTLKTGYFVYCATLRKINGGCIITYSAKIFNIVIHLRI